VIAKPDVLLVEDDACEAELVVRALGPAISVETVGDGAVAIARMRERRPRLVLLDLKMGGRTGFDVLAEAAQHRDLASTPIVVLTSSSDPRDVERAYALGAHGYVVKPIAHAQLTERLRSVATHWLGGASHSRAGIGA
jgi:CheY-like chemotaxis protein